MPDKKSAINLLPQEEFEASMMGRVLKWATGTFRIIVIVTEMIVMGAFLSRFWLDAQNSDLTEAIDIKSAQIEAQSDFERNFRSIQKKISIFKALETSAASTSKFSLIASKLPQEIILSGISADEKSTQIKGTSATELGIAQFIANLKEEKSFKSVKLTSLSTPEDNPNSIVFTINIDN